MYDVPKSSLDEAIHRLYLSQRSQPMSVVWPAFWNYERFIRVRQGHIYNVFLVMDAESDYCCVTTKWELYRDYGPCYDINRRQPFSGYTYYGYDNQVLISADVPVIYYALHEAWNNLQLSQFHFRSQRLRDIAFIDQYSPWRNLCQEGTMIFSSGQRCRTPFKMPVLKGFVTNQNFYLFGKGTVTVFPIQVYLQPERRFKVSTIAFEEFFYCPKKNWLHTGLSQGKLTPNLDFLTNIQTFQC